MLEDIKDAFKMPISEDNMDNIVENNKNIAEIAQGVIGKRERAVKEAQKEVNKCMDNMKLDPKNPQNVNPKAVEDAIEADNNLTNANKRLEHAKLVARYNDLNSIVEEVINEVSDEWIRNKLKNTSKAEIENRIKQREANAQAYNKSAEAPHGLDIHGHGEKSKQKAEEETKKADRLKDIKSVAKPSIMDRAKQTISNFKKSGAEATKSVIDRAKEAIKNVGDSKVKDLGKSLKAEGKGVADAVKQGVKDTVKGTTQPKDEHTASKSAIDRAKEVIKAREERASQKEEDMNERAKNLAKQKAEKDKHNADMKAKMEDAKKELESKEKADDNKDAEVKADDNKESETKANGNKEAEVKAQSDDKKEPEAKTEDEETKADDNKEAEGEDKEVKAQGGKKTTKTTDKDGSKTNNVNAINNANISGKQDGNVTINQTASATRQGETKTEETSTDDSKADNKEEKPAKRTRLVKKTQPAEETTEVKAEGEDNKKEDEAKTEDDKNNKPAEETTEVKAEDNKSKIEGLKIPKKYANMSDDELRKELKQRQDVVAKAGNLKENPKVNRDSEIKKMGREDLLKAIFDPKFLKAYKDANKKAKAEETTEVKADDKKVEAQTETNTDDKKSDNKTEEDKPVEVKAEANKENTQETGKQSTEGQDKNTSKEGGRRPDSSEVYKKNKEIEDNKKKEERAKLNETNAGKLSKISQEVRNQCKESHEGDYADETEELEHIQRVYNNKLIEAKNTIDSLLGEFDEDAVKAILQNINKLYKEAKGSKDQSASSIIKGVPNHRIVELGDAIKERGKITKFLDSLK